MPRALLVGRNSQTRSYSAECGGLAWTTDLDAALGQPEYSIYFDAQTTDGARTASASHRRGEAVYAKSWWPPAWNLRSI